MAPQDLPIRASAEAAPNGVANSPVSFGHSIRDDFLFDKDYVNLNHGIYIIKPINDSE
jgi:hypothetical protein